MFKALTIALLALSAASLKFQDKGLSLTSLAPDFDFTRFQGKWFEVVRSKNLFIEGHPTTWEYCYDKDSQVVSIRTATTYFGRTLNIDWHATWHHDVPSIWTVRLNCRWLERLGLNYTIVDTDYDNWAVVWTNNNIYNWNIGAVWILSRTQDIDHDHLAHAINVLEQNTPFTKDNLVPL